MGGPNELLAAEAPQRSEITTVELRDVATLGDRLLELVDDSGDG